MKEILPAFLSAYSSIASSEYGKVFTTTGTPPTKRTKRTKPDQGGSLSDIDDDMRLLFAQLTQDSYWVFGVKLNFNILYTRDGHTEPKRLNEIFCRTGVAAVKAFFKELAQKFSIALFGDSKTDQSANAALAFEMAVWFQQLVSPEILNNIYTSWAPELVFPTMTARLFSTSSNQMPKKQPFVELGFLMRVFALSLGYHVDFHSGITNNKGKLKPVSYRCLKPLPMSPANQDSLTQACQALPTCLHPLVMPLIQAPMPVAAVPPSPPAHAFEPVNFHQLPSFKNTPLYQGEMVPDFEDEAVVPGSDDHGDIPALNDQADWDLQDIGELQQCVGPVDEQLDYLLDDKAVDDDGFTGDLDALLGAPPAINMDQGLLFPAYNDLADADFDIDFDQPMEPNFNSGDFQ
eukprot:TRINITY_DN4586_c0_g1_i2.p1 TRINITY_DN4586_c0_g1~~TRINITY_DN4586_c0_g1_i2.p1  ORF type:complete len:404 (+),score=101.76 TRINITY_DN4586_c0_g1_i2:70-1281(+)